MYAKRNYFLNWNLKHLNIPLRFALQQNYCSVKKSIRGCREADFHKWVLHRWKFFFYCIPKFLPPTLHIKIPSFPATYLHYCVKDFLKRQHWKITLIIYINILAIQSSFNIKAMLGLTIFQLQVALDLFQNNHLCMQRRLRLINYACICILWC